MAVSSSSSSQILVIFQEEELPSGLFAILNVILLKSPFKVMGILNFSRHLLDALRRSEINFIIATEQDKGGDDLNNLFKRIEDSGIAIVVFSSRYTESKKFLDALVKIRERAEEGKLVAIPIFYKVEPSNVIYSKGDFGNRFKALAKGNERKRNWKEALKSISKTVGFTVNSKSPESEMLNEIVKAVKRVLKKIPSEGSRKAYVDPSVNIDTRTSSGVQKDKTFGIKQRLNELKEKLHLNKITRPPRIIIMGCLLLLFFVLQQIGYRRTTRLIGERGAINRLVENLPKVVEYIASEGTENPSNENTEFHTGELRDELKRSLDELNEKVDVNKIRCQLLMTIGFLLLLFFVVVFVHQQIGDRRTRLAGQSGAIYKIKVNVPKPPKYIPAEETQNPRDTYTEFSTGSYELRRPENYSSDVKTNTDLVDRTITNSRMGCKVKPPQIQVFISFRGDQLRNNFVGYLVDALRRREINVFIDNQERRGEDLNTLFKRIEDSGIAIVVFSSRYTESKWCLEELVKIKERVHQGLLKVLPIFYKVSPTNVRRLKGEFGDHFRDKEHRYDSNEPMIKRWKEAILFVSHKYALILDEKSSELEIDFVETIVSEVLKMLQSISKVQSGQYSR